MSLPYGLSFVILGGFLGGGLILCTELALAQDPPTYTFSYSISHDDLEFSQQIPIEKHLTEILEKAGFEIANKEERPSDLALGIEVRGIPVGASYRIMFEESTLYTGAQVEGTISGKSSRSKVLKNQFSGRIAPPSRIEITSYSALPQIYEAGYLNKKDAPFSKAWAISDFWNVLGRIIGKTLGRNASISYWIGVIQATSLELGDKATIGLKEIGHKAVPSLISLFDSPYRERALTTVHQIGKPAVPYLISGLEKNNIPIQRGIADALGRIQDPKVIPALTKLSTNHDTTVRAIAIKGLGEIKATEVIPLLRKALKDPDSVVQSYAVAGIKNFRNKGLDILINELHTENYDHLKTVAKALDDMGQKKAIRPLIESLKTLNKQSNVPNFYLTPILEALKNLSGQDLGASSKVWLKWWESEGQF